MTPIRITTIFCLCDDLVKDLESTVRQRRKMSTSEVMLIGICAALWFGGNVRKAALFLVSHRYLSELLSEGRLNRRLRKVPEELWLAFNGMCLAAAGKKWKKFAVDSFPIPVCHNIRARRCRLCPGKQFRGYTASKNQYFHGLKCHAIVTGTGQVVSFLITPGSVHDMTAFRYLDKKDVPKGSRLYADAAYTNYRYEETLAKLGIHLRSARRYTDTRQHSAKDERLIRKNRKVVETTFSRVLSRFPRSIRATSPEGFELKILLFMLADTIECTIN